MSYGRARQVVLSLLPKGGTGAEIGVWKGDFSEAILRATQPVALHLIDPWARRDDPAYDAAWYGSKNSEDIEAVYRAVCQRFAAEIGAGIVRLHRQPSAEALSRFAANSLDFVYVDGDHSYDAVRADLALAAEKVRPGGLICIDDHSLGKWWEDGIVRAVNELLGAHPRGLMLQFCANAQVVIGKR